MGWRSRSLTPSGAGLWPCCPRGVVLEQVAADRGRVVQAAGFEDVDEVTAGVDHDGVPVLADFPVGLRVQVGRGDQDAELAVAQP